MFRSATETVNDGSKKFVAVTYVRSFTAFMPMHDDLVKARDEAEKIQKIFIE